MSYIVISDHPYYPAITYVPTLQEATAIAFKEKNEMMVEDGTNEIKITIARVLSSEEGKSHY